MDRLLAQQDAIAAILEKIEGTPFSAGAKSRVFHQGDTLDRTKLSACIITFGEENSDDIDTRRSLMVAPWALQVWFDSDYQSGDNNRQRHAHLLELIKNAINADRTLGGTVIDNLYTGGGNKLEPEGTEAEGDMQTFTCRFESTYRHLTTDSSSAV